MTTAPAFAIGGRAIGPGHPVYVVAELSANHHQDLATAEELVRAAARAGADAVKLQTYTPDSITLDCDGEHFRVGAGSLWEGRNLYDLYREACTPGAWFAPLSRLAAGLGMQCFSSVFDADAVDFLEAQGAPAYKIASFELVDIPLLRRAAMTGKPMIVSTGMADKAEIDEAVQAIREAGSGAIAVLHANSGYPAKPAEMNLLTLADLAREFGVVVGLSDHTLDAAVAVAAVGAGAHIIEKHLTLSREVAGPDAAFSLEPAEFTAMVRSVRVAGQALGTVRYGATDGEVANRQFRRSLFVVRDVGKGDAFSTDNVRSIRPSGGLHTRHLADVVGRRAARPVAAGTPLSWDLLG